jgi:SAM-dependent methyltransferase
VLEVGAGDGALAVELRAIGHEVLAIDPAAEAPGVTALALHEVPETDQPFDAAVAVLSLHHVEPLHESCRHLATLIRPGGVLVIDEFDVERFDERAARWWLGQRAAIAAEDGHGADHHAHDPAGLVVEMRGHVHPLAAVRGALAEDFALGEPVRVPYLHRWYLGEGLRAAEEHLIAEGALPATGARLVGTRR